MPPLPGSPLARESVHAIATTAVREAKTLKAHGFDAVVVENFGDAPFFAGSVPAVTVASMAAIGERLREVGLPMCVNVLRNDAESALAICVAIGAVALRVNVLTGARVTDQGVVEGRAAELFRARRALGAENVRIWADVDVKHSAPLAARKLTVETQDLVKRALADCVLVTGDATGASVDTKRLRVVRQAAGGAPVLVASGATRETLKALARHADGVIVGSALRREGRAGAPLEEARVDDFASAFRKAFTGGDRSARRSRSSGG